MTIQLRDYQLRAVRSLHRGWNSGEKNLLVEMATGTGKSLVVADMAKRIVKAGKKGVIVVPRKELARQNYNELIEMWPEGISRAGINCASLNERDVYSPIIIGTIQSLLNTAHRIGKRNYIIVDEAHLIPMDEIGTYHELIRQIGSDDARIAGLTATPYRLKEGSIYGEGRFFERKVYSYGYGEGLRDGFLAPLVTPSTNTQMDMSGVKKVAGEFNLSQMNDEAMRITESAIDEIVSYGKDRKAWMIFCSGVENSKYAADLLVKRGISTAVVTQETSPGDRENMVRSFSDGRVRCMVNCEVFTTGFNVKKVDMIALLRATLSTSLYVQMIGRGTRIHPEKADCLVLDYGGNVKRHGPIDNVILKVPGKGKGEMPLKECPKCHSVVPISKMVCDVVTSQGLADGDDDEVCGHIFVSEEKPSHEKSADTSNSVSCADDKARVVNIKEIFFVPGVTKKGDEKVTMTYVTDEGQTFNRTIVTEMHAVHNNVRFFEKYTGTPAVPVSSQKFMANAHNIRKPISVRITPSDFKGYPKISHEKFEKEQE